MIYDMRKILGLDKLDPILPCLPCKICGREPVLNISPFYSVQCPNMDHAVPIFENDCDLAVKKWNELNA